MLRSIYLFVGVLSYHVPYVYPLSSSISHFRFDEEARPALCPFVGTEGMMCFNGTSIKPSGRNLDPDHMKLPRGVGISIDRSTGRLMALAANLTYSPEGIRTWTDGHTGTMFDIFNEATHGPASRVVAAYNAARVHIFHNATQLSAAWRQTFADGKVRGGELARPPDMLAYVSR